MTQGAMSTVQGAEAENITAQIDNPNIRPIMSSMET
jgi:hypothetical protein